MDSFLDRNSMTIRGGMVNDDGSKYYGGRFDQQLNSRNRGPRPSQQQMEMQAEARRMEEMERQVPPEAEDYPVAGPLDGPPRSVGSWSLTALILAAVALLTIIIFIAWYFGSGEYRKGTTSSVKDIINNEVDTAPTVASLTVTGNTTLGTDAADTLNVKADVSSDLIPDSTSGAYDLGSSSKQWGTVYVDNVSFDDGTMTQASDDNVRLTGAGFGFRRPVVPVDLSGTATDLGISNSGYTYTLNNGTSSTDYTFALPAATGSGIFYDFIFSQDFAVSNGDFGGVIEWTSLGGGIFRGTTSVTSNPGGDGTSTVVFVSPSGSTVDQYLIDFNRPVNDSLGASYSVLEGSTIRMTDYDTDRWVVDGNLITVSGVSGGNMNTPFV